MGGGKFNASKVSAAMTKFGVDKIVAHRNIIIPGYVAVMSGTCRKNQDGKWW